MKYKFTSDLTAEEVLKNIKENAETAENFWHSADKAFCYKIIGDKKFMLAKVTGFGSKDIENREYFFVGSMDFKAPKAVISGSFTLPYIYKKSIAVFMALSVLIIVFSGFYLLLPFYLLWCLFAYALFSAAYRHASKNNCKEVLDFIEKIMSEK